MNRKIAIFTGNRAEYGLLSSIIFKVNDCPNLDLQLLVSGAHLDPKFGGTKEQIKASGIEITDEIEISLSGDDLYATTCAIGDGVQKIASSLNKYKPDILIVYADRFEGFAAVVAASQMGIPVAHIEGGDITEGGALDDSLRHAMTKLSHLHFTTNEEAYRNVIRMGEEPWRVFNIGLPSLDGIYSGNFSSEDDLVSEYGLDLTRPVIVFTQHSVTTQYRDVASQISSSLDALSYLLQGGCQVFITYPNNDAGGSVIIKHIEDFKSKCTQSKNLFVVPSLGARRYHGLLALARDLKNKIVCVGNSSSGIKETPVFGCPTVNIGTRQDGRLRAFNTLDVGYGTNTILDAVNKCLTDEVFRKKCSEVQNPYGVGDSATEAVRILASVALDDKLITKKHLFN